MSIIDPPLGGSMRMAGVCEYGACVCVCVIIKLHNRAIRPCRCLLTRCPPITAKASIYYTVYRHRSSSEFIGSRHCVPMAFIAVRPPAQGQQ